MTNYLAAGLEIPASLSILD